MRPRLFLEYEFTSTLSLVSFEGAAALDGMRERKLEEVFR